MALASYLVLFILSIQSLLSLSEEDFNPRCPPIPCGILGFLSFPFYNGTNPECGLFIVDKCNEPGHQKILLGEIGSYHVKFISRDNKLWLRDQVSETDHNCKSLRNLTYPRSPFISFDIPFNSTLFKCPHSHDNISKNYDLLCNDSTYSIYFDSSIYSIYFNNSKLSIIHDNQLHNNQSSPPAQCSVIQQQVTKTEKNVVFNNIYTSGFGFLLQVNVTRECYECHWRGGRCLDDSKGNFYCSKPEPYTKITESVNVTRECFECHWRGGRCLDDSKGNFYCSKVETGSDQGRSIIKVSVATTASGVGILIIILVLCFRKKISSNNSMAFWRKKTKNYQNIEAFIRNYGSLAPKRYSYSQIKKMTNSFKVKLGQGGYGGVYKGRLSYTKP